MKTLFFYSSTLPNYFIQIFSENLFFFLKIHLGRFIYFYIEKKIKKTLILKLVSSIIGELQNKFLLNIYKNYFLKKSFNPITIKTAPKKTSIDTNIERARQRKPLQNMFLGISRRTNY